MKFLRIVLLLAAGTASLIHAEVSPVVFVQAALGYQGATTDASLGLQAEGSAFVVDLEGLGFLNEGCRSPAGTEDLVLLTNEHVVRSANELQVTFLDVGGNGETREISCPATVIETDPRADLALLTVSAETLAARSLDPAAVSRLKLWMGNPADLAQGTEVVALGNPVDFRQSATQGVISAPQQSVEGERLRLVQTDAAINPGNSGGPLVKEETGEVVGINTLTGDGAENIGFALPAHRAVVFLRQVLCGGGPRHAWTNLVVVPVDERIRSALRLPEQRGAVVVRKVEALAPGKNPLEEMDVIFSVKGTRQPEAGGGVQRIPIGAGGIPLSEALFDLEPGTEAEFEIVSPGKRRVLRVPLLALDLGRMGPQDFVEFQGAMFEDLTVDVRMEYDAAGPGVLLGALRPGSPAAEADFRPWEVLQSVWIRDGETFYQVETPDLAAFSREAPNLQRVLDGAGVRPVLLGFRIFNLETGRYGFHFLRSGWTNQGVGLKNSATGSGLKEPGQGESR